MLEEEKLNLDIENDHRNVSAILNLVFNICILVPEP